MDSNCYRDKILEYIKETKSFLTIIPDKINYFDISSSSYNLIEKESRLFENTDILIIIPESAGSFAEIGMIASMINNHTHIKEQKKFAEKILILLDEKYKYDDSFIRLGPIKNIRKFGGKLINIDFDSNNFFKIKKHFSISNKSKKKVYFNEKGEIFFINCLQILIIIYYNKIIKIPEKDFKSKFIFKLKQKIHNGITEDNIEYLESAELINKKDNEGKITIEINHQHHFIKDLIEFNFELFNKNNILFNFLKNSGY